MMLRLCLVDAPADHIHLLVRAITDLDAGIEISAFSDGASALAFLQTTTVRPDVVLLGRTGPRRGRCDLLRAVKTNTHVATIPVVILTSLDQRADLAWAYELGASGDIAIETVVQDLHAILAHTRLYWQVMRRADPASSAREPV